jgi:3-oxoacyl-[acyl-carrier protein] reductase
MTDTAAFEGRAVTILGAASDMGLAIARAFGEAGAHVWMADVDGVRLNAHAERLRSAGLESEVALVDVTDAEAVDRFVASADAAAGGLAASVHLAGIIADAEVLDMTEAELDRLLAVNLKGVLFGCQSAGRRMVARGRGAIVNMASMGAFTAIPELAGYSMSKAAVVALTRTLALELAPRGVRANAVAPGYIEGGMTQRHLRDAQGVVDAAKLDAAREGARRRNPLGLVGQPEDVAAACLYLASDAARYVTGQIIHTNGGAFMP